MSPPSPTSSARPCGPAPIAVGECGLDFHYDHSPRDDQRTAFAEQIGFAHRLGLPLVIHTREAWDDTFAILDAEGVPGRTIFHCFTGGPDEARRCLERDAFVSFSGIVTFKGAPEVAAAAALVPLDRLLVETDSPYLAPVPHRGRRNRPAWVTDVGAHIAGIRGLAVDEVRDRDGGRRPRGVPCPRRRDPLTNSRFVFGGARSCQSCSISVTFSAHHLVGRRSGSDPPTKPGP